MKEGSGFEPIDQATTGDGSIESQLAVLSSMDQAQTRLPELLKKNPANYQRMLRLLLLEHQPPDQVRRIFGLSERQFNLRIQRAIPYLMQLATTESTPAQTLPVQQMNTQQPDR